MNLRARAAVPTTSRPDAERAPSAPCVSIARIAGPGGDRAVALRCPEGITHIFVCDVSGRGAGVDRPAAFLADAVRVLVHQGMSVALTMRTLDATFAHYSPDDGIFASAFLAAFGEDHVTYASAGHPDVYLFDGSRGHRHLTATGPLLGLFTQAPHEETTLRWRAGDALVAATDGVLDARIALPARLGEARFTKLAAEALRARRDDPSAAIIENVHGLAPALDDDYAVLTATA